MTREEFIKKEYREYQFSTVGIDVWEEGAFRAGFEAALKLSLPPADATAEEILKKLTGKSIEYLQSNFVPYNTILQAMHEFAAQRQPQPTAEGAGEIRQDAYKFLQSKGISDLSYITDRCKSTGYGVAGLITEFATLHAQRIADKIVEGKLREELKDFYLYIDENWALGMLTGKVDNVIDKYLKSREK